MQETEKPRNGPAFMVLFRNRSYGVFYGGMAFSGFGSTFAQFAITWQVYEMTESALHLGLLGLSRFASLIPFLLLGGLLADAIDRRKMLMFTQFGHLVILAGILFATHTGAITVGMFYVAAVIGSVFTALENPARQAIVPNLVPQEDLVPAIALNTVQRTVSSLGGQPMAGVIYGFLGPTTNYAFGVASLAFMILVLALIRPVNKQTARSRRQVSLSALAEGMAHVKSNPILFVNMLLDFAQNFLGAARALLPIYAAQILDVGPQGAGFLSAASSAGTLIGGALFSTIATVKRMGVGVLIGISIFAVSTILFAYNTSFVIALVLLAGEGFGDVVSHTLRSTILQLNVPDDLRGRVTSLNQLFVNGGGPLGNFRAGAMAELVGPEMAVLTGGVTVLAIVILVALFVPMVRNYQIEDAMAVPAGH